MTGQQDTVPAAEVLDLLAAIAAALDVPAAATYEGLASRDRLIVSRAAYMAGALGQSCKSGRVPDAEFFRNLAGQPLGYQPAGGAA